MWMKYLRSCIKLMIEAPVVVLVVLFVGFLVLLAFYIGDLREQIKQLQWEANFHREISSEYQTKFIDTHMKLQKLKEKKL